MQAKTLTQKILAEKIDKSRNSSKGSYVKVEIDLILGPDPALALLIDDFYNLGMKLWDKERIIVTVDHFAPPSSIDRANILKKVLDFVRREEISNVYLFSGVCHQILVEHPQARPGKVIVGADSHTATAGALGCFATGFGSMDILYSMVTGRTWIRIPEGYRVDLKGTVPEYITGADIILEILGRFRPKKANYNSLEFFDLTTNKICMDSRFSICNMAVECEAKNAIFTPDEVTYNYLKETERTVSKDLMSKLIPDEDAPYQSKIEVEITHLQPKVALPYEPQEVVQVSEVEGQRIDQVFIGSCAGGRLEDLKLAARIMDGHKKNERVRLIVIPASSNIYREALTKGYIKTLIESGATICNPSCGPCGGIDKGILSEDEICLATSNRNFKGRMGDLKSLIFLASASTAAASAIEGRIADPRKYL